MTLKSDTPLPPIYRTLEIEHHRVMGRKKEIYRDVPFFHGAIQLCFFLVGWCLVISISASG